MYATVKMFSYNTTYSRTLNISWLYRLKSSDQTTGTRVSASEQQMLESLISKAKQANFMYLQALGELGKSQRQIQQVN
jgi:hypothetical protein